MILPLFLALGFWQLDRAGQKRALFEDFTERQNAAVLNINREYTRHDEQPEKFYWRKATADGSFARPVHVLLDNQINQRSAGYFVYTPFKLAGTDAWILANRGWVAVGRDRAVAPELDVDDAISRINGSIKAPPKTGILLKEHVVEQLKDGVYRVQRLAPKEIEDVLGLRLLPYILRMSPDSPGGLARRWEQPGADDVKHLGYAFQWFAMAAALLVIYLALNIKKA